MSEFPGSDQSPSMIADTVRERAIKIGFDLVGISEAGHPAGFGHLQRWLEQRFDGEMQYMRRREEAYRHPDGVLPGVRSVIVVALNYHSDYHEASDASVDELDLKAAVGAGKGRVASYANGTGDYHDILRRMLKQLGAELRQIVPGCRTRPVVDTAPLLERDFARTAGLGWFGKNTMLINRRAGSWLFLGALLTDVELEPDSPHDTAHCGTCTRCLEACPTDAFAEPYVLDARKCISYLTIELRDQPVPPELRDGMNDWVFGCDICQQVCPWNRHASETTISEFRSSDDLAPLDLRWLLSLNYDQFQERFRKTPFERPGRSGLLRNAAIAAGNSGDVTLVSPLIQCLNDEDELVRGAAAWALGKLGGESAAEALSHASKVETASDVQLEITAARRRLSGTDL